MQIENVVHLQFQCCTLYKFVHLPLNSYVYHFLFQEYDHYSEIWWYFYEYRNYSHCQDTTPFQMTISERSKIWVYWLSYRSMFPWLLPLSNDVSLVITSFQWCFPGYYLFPMMFPWLLPLSNDVSLVISLFQWCSKLSLNFDRQGDLNVAVKISAGFRKHLHLYILVVLEIYFVGDIKGSRIWKERWGENLYIFEICIPNPFSMQTAATRWVVVGFACTSNNHTILDEFLTLICQRWWVPKSV